MYYTTRGTGYAKIMRADLTTHNPVVLVNSSLSWPTGLVLDKPGNHKVCHLIGPLSICRQNLIQLMLTTKTMVRN